MMVQEKHEWVQRNDTLSLSLQQTQHELQQALQRLSDAEGRSAGLQAELERRRDAEERVQRREEELTAQLGHQARVIAALEMQKQPVTPVDSLRETIAAMRQQLEQEHAENLTLQSRLQDFDGRQADLEEARQRLDAAERTLDETKSALDTSFQENRRLALALSETQQALSLSSQQYSEASEQILALEEALHDAQASAQKADGAAQFKKSEMLALQSDHRTLLSENRQLAHQVSELSEQLNRITSEHAALQKKATADAETMAMSPRRGSVDSSLLERLRYVEQENQQLRQLADQVGNQQLASPRLMDLERRYQAVTLWMRQYQQRIDGLQEFADERSMIDQLLEGNTDAVTPSLIEPLVNEHADNNAPIIISQLQADNRDLSERLVDVEHYMAETKARLAEALHVIEQLQMESETVPA